MAVEMSTQLGTIDVSEEVIAMIAGGAALECYGLVGMASRSQIRDGIAELLRRDNFSKGIEVRHENGDIHIDLYIIVSYGTRISEVAHNVQTKVKYTLNEIIGLEVNNVNVIVQGVRVINS